MGNWTFVKFQPKNTIILDCSCAREILARIDESSFEVKTDLGLRKTRVRVAEGRVLVEGLPIGFEELKMLVEDVEGVYSLSQEGLSKLIIAGERFYKLKRVGENTAPTLEVDGIHMHKIVGTTPWEDARKKVLLARIKPSQRVLDTCMGLGYTAIHSALIGAEVTTVEIDPNVIELASYNPWSRGLDNPRIQIILGNVCELVRELQEESFDRIIHDPPRFSGKTGALYGREFYAQLYRALREGGVLFHYVGSPRKFRGVDLIKSVARRLREVGFRTEMHKEAEAVLAFKLK
jgi:predicted methyltransferase